MSERGRPAGPSPWRRRSARGWSPGRRRRRSRPSGRRSRAAAAAARRPGCCRPRSSRARAGRGRRGRTGSARAPGAGRGRPRGGRSVNLDGAERATRSSWVRRLSSKVPIRMRSWRSRSRSTSATERRSPSGKRSVSASRTPVLVDHRLPVPGQVGGRLALAGRGVDVGGQAARRRDRHSSLRSSARPTVIGLPDRFTSTVAPASAASELGGTGTHRSSQISTCTTRPGTVRARRRAGRGRTAPPCRRPRSSPRAGRRPGAIWRRS